MNSSIANSARIRLNRHSSDGGIHSESVANNEDRLFQPAALIDFGGDKAEVSITTRRAPEVTEQSAKQMSTIRAYDTSQRGTGIPDRSDNFAAASLDGRKVIRLLPATSKKVCRMMTDMSKMNSISVAGELNSQASI